MNEKPDGGDVRRKQELSGKQARHLRALGHSMRPVATVGKDGVTEAVLAAVDQSLAEMELVKVKVGQGCPVDRKQVAGDLSHRTGSTLAQVLGRTMLLWAPIKPVRLDPKLPDPS